MPRNDLWREFRRIGVDTTALGGMAGPRSLSGDDLLAWLRQLPTGLGHEQFLKRLTTDGPRPGMAADGIPSRDLTFQTPDLDAEDAFQAELDRLLPPNLGFSWGIMEEVDYAAAAEQLKRLPNQAGWDAVCKIVPLARLEITNEES